MRASTWKRCRRPTSASPRTSSGASPSSGRRALSAKRAKGERTRSPLEVLPGAGARSGERRLRMRDLEKATGVGRETIRFYIREGLLPEPERPGRNVALYDPSVVARVHLIKELQQKRFLPLHVIRSMLGVEAAPSRDEVQTLLELDGKLFPAVEGAPPGAPERLSVLARRSGFKS